MNKITIGCAYASYILGILLIITGKVPEATYCMAQATAIMILNRENKDEQD